MTKLSDSVNGQPAEPQRNRRRGTVLLLVLGALAMVLILTVVYAALGKGDRSQARAVQDQQDAREVIGDIASYLAQAVGDDVFDVSPDFTEESRLDVIVGGGATLADARYLTEATDAPFTDFTFRSVPSLDATLEGESFAVQELFKFRASGGHSTGALWPDAFPGLDPRVASDPWLAATRPFDLGPGSKDFLPDGTYLDNPYFERALDWQQISNLSPDGRFVNLFYLRGGTAPGVGDGGAGRLPGNFDVPSLDLTRDPDDGEARLGLFDADGDLSMGDNAELGFIGLLDGTGSELNFNNEVPDWNRPAHWTMYQRAMHRSIAELNRLDSTNDPSEPSYWAYQFADADGNGIIDSRWFELVDASRGTEVGLLAQNDLRFFVASRVIDLSSLINVNTASDLIAPPSLRSRIGEGPHEVSLFSLLNMSWHPFAVSGDNPVFYGSGGSGGIVGAFDFPEDQESANDYEVISGASLAEYNAGLLGRKAYKRLRQSLLAWQTLPYEVTPTRRGIVEDPGDTGDDYRNTDMSLFTLELDAANRRDSFISFGSTSPGSTDGGNSRIGPFGVDDLVELMIFHGGNDPDVFTNLEQAFVSDDRQDAEFASRSLLRSDRSLSAEVGERTFLAPGTDGLAGLAERESNRMARAAVDIRSLLTTVSGSRPLRSRVTNAAGVSSLSSDVFRKIRLDEQVIAPAISFTGAANLSDDLAAQQALQATLLNNTFSLYAQTLAPYLDEGGWVSPPGIFLETQFYGHEGPELALRLAAHMAVNFRDMADAPTVDANGDGVPDSDVTLLDFTDPTDLDLFDRRVDEPTRALLWLTSDDGRRTAARNDRPTVIEELEDDGFVLDADTIYATPDPVLDNTAAGNEVASSDAMIIHGIEAQPFLSEVVFMNAFFDAPRGVDDEDPAGPLSTDNTDEDSEYRTNIGAGVFDEFASDGMVNIDWDADGTRRGNPDFLFQLVAFQLFNPFDVPVRLDDMYIEFGNVFYRFDDLAGGVDTVIQPRETVLAYATNPGLALGTPGAVNDNVQRRLDDAAAITVANGGGATPLPPSFDDVLDNAFGAATSPLTPRRLPLRRYDAALTEIDELAADGDLLDGALTAGGTRENAANRTAMLWRDLGDKRDATAWQLAQRRDDVMLDRMTDRVAGDPILDQRLALGGQLIESGFVGGDPTMQQLIEEFTVDNALKGYENNVRFGEFPGAQITGVNFNVDRQLSVLLWGKLRRFDDPAIGSAATPWLQSTFLLGTEVGTRFGRIDPATGLVAPGQFVVNGVPAGALPSTVLEPFQPLLGGTNGSTLLVNTDRSSSQTATANRVIANDGIHVVNSFDRTGFEIAGVDQEIAETANTLEEFFLRLQGTSTVSDEANALTERFESARAGMLGVQRFTSGDYQAVETNALNEPYEENYLTFSRNGLEFRSLENGQSQLRVGDMLLPMAVGPYRRPLETDTIAVTVDDSSYPTDPAERLAAYEAEWVTLGEVLAVVAGYSDKVGPDPVSGNDDPFDTLRVIDNTATPVVDERVLDRGRLRLDAFVPYVNFNIADGFDEGEDRPRGHGIPLALTIFEIAQAGGELQADAYGDIDRPMMGLVNMNTAPPSVLRTVPGLFPDTWYDVNDAPDRNDATANAGSFFWDRRAQSVFGTDIVSDMNTLEPEFPAGGGAPDYALDIASSVAAYRDAASGHVRLERLGAGGAAGFGVPRPYDMTVRGADTAGGAFDAQLGLALGRNRTGIDGIRQQPGFGSIGELLAVRSIDPTDAAQHSMDWMGRDGKTIGAAYIDQTVGIVDPLRDVPIELPMSDDEAVDGVNGITISTVDPQLFGDLLLYRGNTDAAFALPGPDQIADDYDEQLAQINMLLNSTSVSSDYYAAWFLIHGYAEEDTEVSGTDPLTPSFRARYLMILDRSNVVRVGDRPRILALLELPVDVPTEDFSAVQ